MEKFSAYRDAGTGIHPFLNPTPPNAPTLLATALVPIGYLIGILRTLLILLVAVLYFLLVEVTFKTFYSVRPLHKFLSGVCTAIAARFALFLLGLWWIPVVHVTRKRGRDATMTSDWSPRAGDVIVSNWVSWVEILWLAFRFNPIFVLPTSAPVEKHTSRSGTHITNTHGRRPDVRSAAISSTASHPPPGVRVPLMGFHTVSLLGMLRLTGHVPPFSGLGDCPRSLDHIRRAAARPIVVFPECTTSNGRAMLRFAGVFGESTVPVNDFKVFVMCVRYDPPTHYTPTLTYSIPSLSALNPLFHIFQVSTSLSLTLSRSLSFRLLNPAESPSSGNFLASDVLEDKHEDELVEACAMLVSQLGKMRITGQAWEDKAAFLKFYRGKTSR